MRIGISARHVALGASILLGAPWMPLGDVAVAGHDTSEIGTASAETTYRSRHLDAELTILPGVFHPIEAELIVLPLMKENKRLFENAVVLEIGSGSGIVSIYAAKLGAKKVIATDINERAVETTQRNAEKLGVGSIVEARLVPRTDMSAYSVIRDDERFDLIISNPPYSLDLDAPTNNAVTDTGDLGFSIVRGLETHLKPGGSAILLYGSLFYHLAMVKFARWNGYEVRYHRAQRFTDWEVETLFNAYLARLLEREKVDPHAFRFARAEPGTIQGIQVRPMFGAQAKPLFPGNSGQYYPGIIVIERKRTEQSGK